MAVNGGSRRWCSRTRSQQLNFVAFNRTAEGAYRTIVADFTFASS
jgi:hypothetical protein